MNNKDGVSYNLDNSPKPYTNTSKEQNPSKIILSKFRDELPIPPILEPRRKDQFYTYYEVNMTQFKHSFHSELDDTTVWGFENGYPGPTIEVESGEKVFIKWNNNLPDKTSIVSEFIGDTIIVNGKVHPFLKVEPRKYRFRLLNASNTRFYRIKLDSGQLMYQIATDSGFMQYPYRNKRNRVSTSGTS